MTVINDARKRPVETKRAGPVYHKTLVISGYAPVNGLEMYYEIHGAGKPPVTRLKMTRGL